VDILWEGLLCWFRTETIDPTRYSIRYQQLLQEQTSIGWNNLLRGKFSVELTFLQQQYCTSRHITMTHSQRQWLSKLLRTMWSRIHTLWLARNADRHGRTSKAKNQASLQQAHRTIRSLYPLKDQALPEDRDLFYDDVEAHLQQPLRELNAWVSVHQGLIAHSVRVAKLAASSNTKPITELFSRLNPRRRRRYKPTELLPRPVFFRDTKLTSFVTLTRNSRSRRKKPPVPQEKRPYLRQRSLHSLWPDPLG
jgi:hypothetical protein